MATPQDLWISYPDHAGEERTIGTSVQLLRAHGGQVARDLRGTRPGAISTVEGGAEEGRIVLRGTSAVLTSRRSVQRHPTRFLHLACGPLTAARPGSSGRSIA